MRRRKMIIRNAVIGDPIEFYIETKEKNTKRKGAALERMPRGFAEARMMLRAEPGRSVLS